jgi:ATP-dependent DNA helicase RecG
MKLRDSISTLPLVGNSYKTRLEKLGIISIEDLLYHIPSRYVDYRQKLDIRKVKEGDIGTLTGIVTSMKNIYTKYGKKLQIAEVESESKKIQIVWFNQPFLVKSIRKGEKYSFSGKVDLFSRRLSMSSPEFENIQDKTSTIHTGKLIPVYPETYGVSSKWLRGRVNFVWKTFQNSLKDFIEPEDLRVLGLEDQVKAFGDIHFPENEKVIDPAKKRLAFNELLFHHLRSIYRKTEWSKLKSSLKIKVDQTTYNEFLNLLPFTPTKSQMRSIKEVFADLEKDVPMNRLLEGDVGSGKTVVAAAACFAAFVNGYQSVLMAPTQILANQHFVTLKHIFENLKIRISLVTGLGIKADLGKSDIFVGTHALIHKKVDFDKVAVVVIDEQHRFGVEQRAHLIKKSTKGKKVPNILTMTATPIPRTVALTVYGDLDLSILEELPKGRMPITTWIVPPKKRLGAYNWIKDVIRKQKVQAFVICPLIEVSIIESMKQVKAATEEFDNLKSEFKGFKLGLLHGKQKATDKESVLEDFRKGNTNILVATPVVEVGIDVPNATIMIIEAGERFGLAQLHQLRGRIGRGTKKSYCLVFTTHKSGASNQRLSALTKPLNGFELAELDLKLRGPGELMGTRQHGFPELKIASWSDTELIKKSRDFAEKAIANQKKYKKIIKQLHLEDIAAN